MNALEELHNRLDQSDWDIKQEHLIDQAFQDVSEQLREAGEAELRRKSEREREAFAFSKSLEHGLSYKVAGTQPLADGSEVPFEWPDIKEWEEKDFSYIHERFTSTRNVFAKTEYGLLLYYSDKMQDNQEVRLLLKALQTLAQQYYQKSLSNGDKDRYIFYFNLVMAHAFKIAFNRRKDAHVKASFEKLIDLSSRVHNNWNPSHKSALRAIVDLTDFAIEYRKYFAERTSLEAYLDQNYVAALEIAKSYPWGAIYICDVSQRLAEAIDNHKYDWQTLKAQQFEAMVQPAIDSKNLAAVSYVEQALNIYKQIKSEPKIAELSKLYVEVRNIFKFAKTQVELPKEETARIIDIIKKEVAAKTGPELVDILGLTPMLSSLEQIEENVETISSESTFAQLLPTAIVDKHGNTVEVFVDEEEKKKYQFWQTYELSFQLGSRTLTRFFFEALNAGKISFDEVIKTIEPTWIGETYNETYSGYDYEVRPLDVIVPGLKLFFNELQKWKADDSYKPDFICATDSLVSKSEYLLRFFCRLAGIPTFIDKKKGPHKVKMEKNVDELLRALEHTETNPTGFSKEHLVYIQFILSQKAGLNLRNKVAHGLMDAHAYNFLYPLLIELFSRSKRLK